MSFIQLWESFLVINEMNNRKMLRENKFTSLHGLLMATPQFAEHNFDWGLHIHPT